MNLRKITSLFTLLLLSIGAFADIELKATYTDSEGTEVIATSDFTAEAPLHVVFTSNATSLDADATIEWHINHQTSGTSVTRYENDTEYTFTKAGINTVSLLVRQNNEVVDSAGIRITISESHLEMPNAFSPNGDGVNDIFRAKPGYKSIVEFHAYIFNRHGQKLYDWTNITEGWDGTHHGNPVKDGVYFVYVKARGADGIEYNIRRDVNLIRDFNNVTTTSNE